MPTNQSVNITINNSDTQGQRQKQKQKQEEGDFSPGPGVAEKTVEEVVESRVAKPVDTKKAPKSDKK